MANTPEKAVKTRIAEILHSHGAYYVMPMTFGFGASGHPDFVGCIYGMAFGIEAKATAKQKPRTLQLKRLQELHDAGGLAMVVHSGTVEQLRLFLTDLKNKRSSIYADHIARKERNSP